MRQKKTLCFHLARLAEAFPSASSLKGGGAASHLTIDKNHASFHHQLCSEGSLRLELAVGHIFHADFGVSRRSQDGANCGVDTDGAAVRGDARRGRDGLGVLEVLGTWMDLRWKGLGPVCVPQNLGTDQIKTRPSHAQACPGKNL